MWGGEGRESNRKRGEVVRTKREGEKRQWGGGGRGEGVTVSNREEGDISQGVDQWLPDSACPGMPRSSFCVCGFPFSLSLSPRSWH